MEIREDVSFSEFPCPLEAFWILLLHWHIDCSKMTQAAMVALDYGVSSYLNQLGAQLVSLHPMQVPQHKVVVPLAIQPFLAWPLPVLLATHILLALQTPQSPWSPSCSDHWPPCLQGIECLDHVPVDHLHLPSSQTLARPTGVLTLQFHNFPSSNPILPSNRNMVWYIIP